MTHSTRLKRIVNPVLRKLQFWTDRPCVIVSIFNYGKTDLIFSHYTIMRMYLSRPHEMPDSLIEGGYVKK
jgi:hypothetical protein